MCLWNPGQVKCTDAVDFSHDRGKTLLRARIVGLKNLVQGWQDGSVVEAFPMQA